MELWILGPEWAINLAGSAFEKVTFAHVGGRPTAPDASMAGAAIAAARLLAQTGAPVVHDISAGGLALAVAEICVNSGVGATVSYSDWRHLFCEDPHRFVVAIAPDQADLVQRIAGEAGIPAAPVGMFGGSEIAFDRRGVKAVIDLEVATSTWRESLVRRLGPTSIGPTSVGAGA
jgi:phosphoribosylformylglycinamidine (FGAM) synthase-like enzyme